MTKEPQGMKGAVLFISCSDQRHDDGGLQIKQTTDVSNQLLNEKHGCGSKN